MKRFRFNVAILVAIALLITSFGIASAQQPAYNTSFVTSITYQNVGPETATIQFQFYNEKSGNSINVQRTLNAGASDSMFVGGLTGTEALPLNFLGSAVLGSNQPIVATLVQIPQSSTVRNRPLSNGFSAATSNVLLATALKNAFNTTSKFSIQNADSVPVDITLKIYQVGNPTPIATVIETNIPPGAAKYYDMGTITDLSSYNQVNGSATVSAVRSGTNIPANIVGSVLELSTNSVQATAFEGISAGAPKVYVATALCKLSGTNASTAYAVQNVGTLPTNVTVTYSGGGTETKDIPPGAKKSFLACDVNSPNYSGAATVTTDNGQPIVVIAKAFGAPPSAPYLSTAFLGESQGASKLALPYVRYTSNANFNAGTRQRAFIAIQNVGTITVTNVTVSYRDKLGNVIGTHTIPSIAPGAKANSYAKLATGDDAKLLEFGNPEANPGGGFGGGAVIEGPDGSELIAVVRIQTYDPSTGTSVAEDYNGIPIQ